MLIQILFQSNPNPPEIPLLPSGWKLHQAVHLHNGGVKYQWGGDAHWSTDRNIQVSNNQSELTI